MRRNIQILGFCSALATMSVAGVTVAAASTISPGAAAAAKPAGYAIVSATFSLPNGSLVPGSVACPKKKGVQTVPLSGGAEIGSSSLAANINSSYPSATGWHVDADNLSGAATTFSVYAVCAKKLPGYIQQQSAPVSNPADTQSGDGYMCPNGDVLTGGGALSATASAQVNLNSSWPSGTKIWFAYMDNASSTGTSFTVFHVCAKLNVSHTHYTEISGPATPNPAGHETNTSAFCGSLAVIGGGVVSSGIGVSTTINTTFPFTGGWGGNENNSSTSSAFVTAFALCAS
jgi:hypothetical protein